MIIKFLGASQTVTGSKYLILAKDKQILVDCGVFQGERKLRDRNWDVPGIDLSKIDAVLLTHAHIDHTGMLPRYYSLGLNCPVYCTGATSDLMKLLLPDMGYLQEREAEYRAQKGKSRHNPPLPLFTEKIARESLKLSKVVSFDKEIDIFDGVKAKWKRMGHILGAASINLTVDDKRITFSGDIGRYDVPILVDPAPRELGNMLLIESTYGNRSHRENDPEAELRRVVNDTYARKGVLVIPSFAVGRAQLILYYLRKLKEEKKIADLPVIIDSPMACDATDIYMKHPEDYDEKALQIHSSGKKPFTMSKQVFVRDTDASKKLNRINDPMIIISASGMLQGGRILHHLKHRISDEKNTILFVGYQPKGGTGDWIQRGAKTLKLFKEEFPIRAKIETISGLSAHADKDELLRWCKASIGSPDKVAIVHGEKDSQTAFAESLKNELSWNTIIPDYLDEVSV